MITFAVEPLLDVQEAIISIMDEQQAEMGIYKDTKADPNWNLYSMLYDLGHLMIFTIRKSGVLLGYAVFIIAQNPHYQTKMQAEHDLLWLAPSSRKGLLGVRFMKFILKTLREDERMVEVIGFTSSEAYPIAPLLKRLGFKPSEQKFFMEV